MFFLWLNLIRLYSFFKILYLKRRIEFYRIFGTTVAPNRRILNWGFKVWSSKRDAEDLVIGFAV